MHSHWRDCQEWSKIGLPLSTTSNEACKMYDATVTQYVGWYQDDSVGGMEGSMTKMMQADPDFVMGKLIGAWFRLGGKSVHTDENLKQYVEDLVRSSQSNSLTSREKQHVDAIQLWAERDMQGACRMWENILLEHPTDMLAVKFAQMSYFGLGERVQMRDSVLRVLPAWKPTMPLYGYLHGMEAFGLVQTNFYKQAEQAGRKALELNPKDIWGRHAICHVMEMEGRQKEGIAFLSSSVNDWNKHSLTGHCYWHWALYHMERGEYHAALDIYDTHYRGRKDNYLADPCSLLFRLNMEGVDVADRWDDTYDMCKPFLDERITVFNDVHVLLSCLGAKQQDSTKKLMESLRSFVSEEGSQSVVAKEVGVPVCEALVAYDEGDYARAVDLVAPVRYRVGSIGGSNAQLDVIRLFLINAAIRSPNKQHQNLARALLVERKALKDNSPLTDRLMAAAAAALPL
ncbi:tetratricopeptide repeat protein 38-like [Branchiostoma floridae]|uniref:Tetratricopeptide repeat protein 38 n=1 Tax=Branchiostoma floridae TaxID=7739 RepID=A0A9J7LY96_BRAFL|nr:tetratricopeptide repeat protein 38-like [Branchiostoma floridae]XP_035690457.1 tetratricopeptide repeat protein 38-like [Branchiostoma floridae]XP_035690458.1 tetratricopeptide repeat protein 38-like [Branchiostoma floridae]XP_035690459.1 tetratricopeptide repeat protein 38-like [Branchiostoma floridae]